MGDLQYASPATVSRCGMVYVDPKNLKYQPYWKKWLQQEIQNKVSTILRQLEHSQQRWTPAGGVLEHPARGAFASHVLVRWVISLAD